MGKTVETTGFWRFFLFLFFLILSFQRAWILQRKRRFKHDEKRLKATTIDENFRTFLASKRSSGVREKTILSYQQAYQTINKHYPIGEMDMTAL